MASLIIRGFAQSETLFTFLAIRHHDLSGTDYERIAKITIPQAYSILAGSRGGNGCLPIESFISENLHDGPIVPGRLRISRRPDITSSGGNWLLALCREGHEPETIGYLGCGRVMELQAMGADIDLEAGQPDFDAVARDLKRIRITELRKEADRLEAELSASLASA